MAAVLAGVVGALVADPVALGERAVDEHVLRICLAQGAGQAWRAVGQEIDDRVHVGVGCADADPEAGCDLRECVVLA